MFRRSQRWIVAASAACLVSLSGSVYAHDIPGEGTQPGSDFTPGSVQTPASPAAAAQPAQSAQPAAATMAPAGQQEQQGQQVSIGNVSSSPKYLTMTSKAEGWGSEKPGTDSYYTAIHPR